jgi:hypothetical protein
MRKRHFICYSQNPLCHSPRIRRTRDAKTSEVQTIALCHVNGMRLYVCVCVCQCVHGLGMCCVHGLGMCCVHTCQRLANAKLDVTHPCTEWHLTHWYSMHTCKCHRLAFYHNQPNLPCKIAEHVCQYIPSLCVMKATHWKHCFSRGICVVDYKFVGCRKQCYTPQALHDDGTIASHLVGLKCCLGKLL